MRIVMVITIALLAIVSIANIVKLNDWLGRHSVPGAAFLTVYPVPFHIEASYTEGTYQDINLGDSAGNALAIIALRSHCRLMLDGRLVDVGYARSFGTQDGELVMRCKSGGVSWNEILFIQGGIVKQVRISGGLWM